MHNKRVLHFSMEDNVSRNRHSNSNTVLRRIGKKILVFVIVFVIPALLFIGIFHIQHIEVIGASRYTPDQIKEFVFRDTPDSNSIYLYLKYKFFEREEPAFIEKIDVEMVSPNSVKIFVYEKMIAGCVEFMGEYMYFDKDGIVVESSSQKVEAVPVIQGLRFNEIILHQKLNILKNQRTTQQSTVTGQSNAENSDQHGESSDSGKTDKIFDTIIDLTQLIEKYDLKVDIISFGSNYEVTLECDDNTVLLGKKDSYHEAIAELKNILEEAKGLALVIDMRKFPNGTKNIIAKEKKSTD